MVEERRRGSLAADVAAIEASSSIAASMAAAVELDHHFAAKAGNGH